MSDVILGSVMYLNTRKVDNLLESIQGGLVDQLKETTRETTGKKVEGGIVGGDVLLSGVGDSSLRSE
jgi:hypothetical protein